MIRLSDSLAGVGRFRVYKDTDNAGITEPYYIYYSLTVNDGTGDGGYKEGSTPSIVADAPPVLYVFDQWIGDVAYVDNVNSASTFVTMPGANVEVTATYKLIVSGEDMNENQDEYDGDYQ